MSADAPPTSATAVERRIAPRYRPAFGTVCRLATGRPVVGLVWNISRTGVSMLLASPPETGAEVAAELAAEDGGAALAVTLRVVHVRPVPTGDYLLGARFGRPLEDDELRPFLTPPPEAGPGWEPPRKG